MQPFEARFAVGPVTVLLRHYSLGLHTLRPYFYAEASWDRDMDANRSMEIDQFVDSLGFQTAGRDARQRILHNRGAREPMDMDEATARMRSLAEYIANLL